jgi:hypothetical protein
VFGDVVAVQQWHAAFDGPCGEVLGELVAHGCWGDDIDGGDDAFRLAADVGGVPARPTRRQPRQREVDDRVPVDPADRRTQFRLRVDGPGWGRGRGSEPQLTELVDPAPAELGVVDGDDLVGPGLGPGATVPGASQRRAGCLAGVLAAPLGLVVVGVAGDLRGTGAERSGVRRDLDDLAALRVEGVAVGRECLTELRVASDRGVTDPVDGLDAVDHAHRVKPSPGAGGEDAGVDLQVEVTVQVTGPACVVPHHRRLELLDRDLHLTAPRPDPRGGVLGAPPDDLGRSLVLGGVVRGGDLRAQRGGQRPGLGPFTTTSTNRSPLSSVRRRPFAAPELTS